jgi:hypothetical protein
MVDFNGDNPRRLRDILDGKQFDELARQFAEAEPAPDYKPIPDGKYEADLISGEMCESRAGTLGYRCTFMIAAGDHRGRRVFNTFWFSKNATPYSKRDLGKLGITNLEQCKKPVPPGIFCTLRIVERTDDQGTRRNEVREIIAGGVRQDPTGDEQFGGPLPGEQEGGLTR